MSHGCTPGEGPKDKWHGSSGLEFKKELAVIGTMWRDNAWLDHAKETPQQRSKDQGWTKTKGTGRTDIPPEGRCGWTEAWGRLGKMAVKNLGPITKKHAGKAALAKAGNKSRLWPSKTSPRITK